MTLYPQKQHEALQHARQEQTTQEWQQQYAKRAGVEGTISQAVRGFGLRECRYIGLAKTHLQHVLTAAALNLARLDDWFTGKKRAETRVSRFAALQRLSRPNLNSPTVSCKKWGCFRGHAATSIEQSLERQMRVQSHHVQSVFTMTTQHTQITKTFHVVQGSVLSEVLTAASQADMLVLGKAGRSLLRRGQLSSTVRGILPKHFGLTLILKEGACLGTRLAVVYDGSPAANRALLAASQLGGQTDNDETLIVLLLAENERKVQKLQHQATFCLADGDTVLRFRWLTGNDGPRMAAILQTETCGVLVLPVRSSILQNDLLVALLEQLDMPIFLVN